MRALERRIKTARLRKRPRGGAPTRTRGTRARLPGELESEE